jgi:hypothetical protein
MHARMTWLEGSAADAPAAVAALRREALPRVRDQPGFEELLFLVDRDGGRAVAITVWASQEDLENSEDLAQQMRLLPMARWAVSGTERFELAVRVVGVGATGGEPARGA